MFFVFVKFDVSVWFDKYFDKNNFIFSVFLDVFYEVCIVDVVFVLDIL